MLTPPAMSIYRKILLFFFIFSQNIVLSFPAETHQVFLNFRGEELRFSFVSHLADAFERHGVNFFIDVHEYRGKELKHLFVRIEESSIAIALFSPRYSESKWCLNELVKMKSLADKKKLIVIPVFYKVKAEDVKHLKGEFGKIFNKLAMTDPNQIRKWKDTLECVCSYMGMSLPEKSSEADFVKDIVREVQRVLEAIRIQQKENRSYVKVFVDYIIICYFGFGFYYNRLELMNLVNVENLDFLFKTVKEEICDWLKTS